jgi:hypothetical protein
MQEKIKNTLHVISFYKYKIDLSFKYLKPKEQKNFYVATIVIKILLDNI